MKGLIYVRYIVSKNVNQNLIKRKDLAVNGFIKKNKVPINKI